MSDVVAIAAPFLAALAGAYFGARWQVGSEVSAELRAEIDRGLSSLKMLNRLAGNAHTNFISHGTETTPESWAALKQLQEGLDEAKDIRDRLVVRCEDPSPLAMNFAQAASSVESTYRRADVALHAARRRGADVDLMAIADEVSNHELTFEAARSGFVEAARAEITGEPFERTNACSHARKLPASGEV